MACVLRQELREMLSCLQAQIHADGSSNLAARRSQAHLAEMSALRALVAFALLALTGERTDGDARFLNGGQVRDCRDAASLAARELKTQREALEGELRSAQVPAQCAWQDSASANVLNRVVEAESECTRAVALEEERHSTLLRQGLAVCASDVCRLLLDALGEAARPGLSRDARIAIGREAALRVREAATGWLAWYATAEPGKSPAPPVQLPADLAYQSAKDGELAAYVLLLRKCMHLRRQQARLVAIMARMAGASTVVDMLGALQARVVVE